MDILEAGSYPAADTPAAAGSFAVVGLLAAAGARRSAGNLADAGLGPVCGLADGACLFAGLIVQALSTARLVLAAFPLVRRVARSASAAATFRRGPLTPGWP